MERKEFPTKTVEINGATFTAEFRDPTSNMESYHIDGVNVIVPVGVAIHLTGIMKMNGIGINVDEWFGPKPSGFSRVFPWSSSKRVGSTFYSHGELTAKIESWLSIEMTKIAKGILEDDPGMVREAHKVKLYNDWVYADRKAQEAFAEAKRLQEIADHAADLAEIAKA